MVNNGQLGVFRNLTEEVNFGCNVDIIESLIMSNFILFLSASRLLSVYRVRSFMYKIMQS